MHRNAPGNTTAWPAKRLAALLLSLLLAALGLYLWRTGADLHTVGSLALAVTLGLLYTVRGGSLPPLVHRLYGHALTPDDDPRNLPAKLYLPILLIALAAAAGAFYFLGPKR
jgi:hypothetical protein